MIFLRILFPSWKFFDRIGPVATLFYQLSGSDSTKWVACLSPPKRSFLHLLLNSTGNIYLAQQGLVDRLVMDINKMSNAETGADKITHTTSYQMILRLVINTIKQSGLKKASFRFKIGVHTPSESYDAIISNEILL